MSKRFSWPMSGDEGGDSDEKGWGFQEANGEAADEWPSHRSGAMVPAGEGSDFGLALPKPVGKYPVPALGVGKPLCCDVDWPAAVLYPHVARRLAAVGDVYRRPGPGEGLVVVPPCSGGRPSEVTSGSQLGVVIKDRVPLFLVKNGKPKGSRLPAADLNDMVRSELFLTWFPVVDRVADRPEYFGDFELTNPAFNDGGEGHRVYYAGPAAEVVHTRGAIDRFLDAMAFASDADRTNAVAAALTVTLRHFWAGERPIVLITSTKSHGGKDTVLDFATGETVKASVTYETADWAFQKACVSALKQDARVGVLDVGNVRLEDRGREIASAFLERFLTDREPLLHAIGTGPDVRRPNHWVVAMTTNYGVVSKDIMHRALPIHLKPRGNVAGRASTIGNPRYEYLPANRPRIAAELRGMIARWKKDGSPLGPTGGHPMSRWAAAVGGILEANGYGAFLANYPARLTTDDAVRAALGTLGLNIPEPGSWRSARFLLGGVAHLGLTERLIPKGDRESPASRQRALVRVLDAHAEETFSVETDAGVLRLKLDRRPRNPDAGTETQYRFSVLPARSD